MRVEALAIGMIVVAAGASARYFDAHVEARADAAATGETAAPETPRAPDLASYYAASPNEVRIKPGPHHQYFLTAAVNNRPQSFLVDTGASYVALRRSDASSAGVQVKQADFIHPVRTANGETLAAFVTVQRIEIDRIRLDDVDAFILPDEQLGVNLLGMSFLSRLQSVEARNGEMVLRG